MRRWQQATRPSASRNSQLSEPRHSSHHRATGRPCEPDAFSGLSERSSGFFREGDLTPVLFTTSLAPHPFRRVTGRTSGRRARSLFPIWRPGVWQSNLRLPSAPPARARSGLDDDIMYRRDAYVSFTIPLAACRKRAEALDSGHAVALPVSSEAREGERARDGWSGSFSPLALSVPSLDARLRLVCTC